MSKSKLISEMYEIIGRLNENVQAPQQDPTPHEVVGTFVVYGVSVLDEAMLNSISEMSWDQISDVALLSVLSANDFQYLSSSYDESTTTFREVWAGLVEEGAIAEGMDRGAFILAVNRSPSMESVHKYVQWCAKALQESGKGTKRKAAKKSKAMSSVIPGSRDGAEITKNYMQPHEASTDKPNEAKVVMKTAMFKDKAEKDKDRADGMKAVEKTVDVLTKAAETRHEKPDAEAPNLWVDLARERARYS